MCLYPYILSAGLALALAASSWAADSAASGAVPKPDDPAKPVPKKSKGKAQGDKKSKKSSSKKAKPTRMMLIESVDKDTLIVKGSGGSKKAARTQTRYTINEATRILVAAKPARKKAKGGTTPGTRADLKQGAKVVIVARGDVAEQVTIIPAAKTKKKKI